MNEIQKISFNQDQVELIKKQIAPKATENELKLFLYQCQRTGLDPLTRQIYCIHRGNSMTIQTSIDGFRVIAERSGDYAGQDEPVFTEENGKIISCKVTVYRFRGEQRYPAAVGVAYMSEYNAGGPMWSKMPHTMISKCAEAVALRKAYPQDLSGLYTGDEMQQAEPIDEVGHENRDYLLRLIESSTYEERQRVGMRLKVNSLTSMEDFEKAKTILLANQLEFDGAVNPSAKEINREVAKMVAND
jgi:phage recombination protein Bet